VREGEASFYALDDRLLDLHDFAALLDCCPADGTDDESGWPEPFAGEWQVIDGAIDDSGGRRFAEIVRLVTVERTSEASNSYERTVVVFWAEHGGRHVPLLAANERLIERKEIASYHWAVDNTGAPISWAGSVALVSVADGVAASIPNGDEIEMGRNPNSLTIRPTTTLTGRQGHWRNGSPTLRQHSARPSCSNRSPPTVR
jgi:hypothetical protein